MWKLTCFLLLVSLAAAQQQPAPPRPQGRQQRQNGQPQDQSQAPAAPQTNPEDLCAVEGQVLNSATGEPLKKATVTLRRVDGSNGPNPQGPPRSYIATSDATGKYTIANVEPGKYRLSATRTGYVDADYGSRDYLKNGTILTFSAKQRMTGMQFSMVPNAVITGKVFDEDREPVASAQVEAMRYRYSQGKKQLVAYGSASTNDIGEYRISGLPAGRYFISVSNRRTFMGGGPGRAVAITTQETTEEYVRTFYPGTADPTAAAPVDIGAGAQMQGADVGLVKRQTVVVKGHITNASGSEGRRLMVTLTSRDAVGTPSAGRPTGVDQNGNFEIRGVTPGAYTLVAGVMGRGAVVTARMPLEVGRSNMDNVAVSIQPPMNVSGSFKIDGQTAPIPLSGIQVTLLPKDGGDRMSGPNPTGKVADDASFQLPNVNADLYVVKVTSLPDGLYIKSVRTGNQEVLLSALDFSKGTASPIEILLGSNAGQVTGSVQNDQQQPAAGVSVVLIPQEPEKRQQSQYYRVVTTDDTGRFSVKNLEPGQYKAFAWQEIESGAYLDPDFVRPVENRGEPVSIREGSLETLQVKLIT